MVRPEPTPPLRRSRRSLVLILPFQTHNVLLGEQADEPLANTLAYFGINYAILAVGLGIATLIHRRRHSATDSSAAAPSPAR